MQVGGEPVAVSEVVVERRTPFCSLLHFRKAAPFDQPRVLLIAPLAGHFATLLRGTVATMLTDHDVYLTDWHNARDVPVSHGPFGFDDFVVLLMDFLGQLGPDVHVVAVCQPTVATLAAVARMAEDGHPATPRSMTLMAGPIDTRVQPTRVDELAVTTPLAWFEQHLIDLVPLRFAGAGRRVYPGYLQVAAFLSMHPARHVGSLLNCYQYLVQGDTAKAEAIRAFYADYFATMDVPAEFYLDTVSKVFQQHALPRGQLMVHGRRGSAGHPAHGIADHRGGKRRHLRGRPDGGGPGQLANRVHEYNRGVGAHCLLHKKRVRQCYRIPSVVRVPRVARSLLAFHKVFAKIAHLDERFGELVALAEVGGARRAGCAVPKKPPSCQDGGFDSRLPQQHWQKGPVSK